MSGLLRALLATVLVFGLVLGILGVQMGPVELLIWTVLLLAMLVAEVVYFRRRTPAR